MDREDKFLIETLRKVYEQTVEERMDITRTDEENSQLAAECDDAIERFNRLLPEIKGVIDLYELEEEDFVFIIEALEEYSDSFIVDGRTQRQLEKDLKEYEELTAFLDQFYDDGEDGEDFEDEDPAAEE